jgi:hypothetical protein
MGAHYPGFLPDKNHKLMVRTFTHLSSHLLRFGIAVALFLSSARTATAQCTLICDDLIQVALDQDCEAEIMPDDVLEGNNCPNGNLQVQVKINGIWTPSVGNFVATGANINQTLQYRVRDLISGNSCTGNLTIKDNIKPILSCQDIFLNCAVTSYTPAYLEGTLGIAQAYPDIVDNCNNSTLSYVDTWGQVSCGGTINGLSGMSAYTLRKWMAIDASGNTGSCNQYLYFERKRLTDLALPANKTISCQSPDINPSVTGVPLVKQFGLDWPIWPSDGFCDFSSTYTDLTIDVCDGSTTTVRTWVIHESCFSSGPSNPLNHVQVIKVVDTLPPVPQCPENVTVSTNPNDCHRDYNLPDFIVADSCSGMASLTAYWTDYNGIGRGLNGSFTTFPGNNPWAPDTMAILGFANDLPVGDNQIRYIMSDDCGNTSVCNFIVTVQDDVPPTAACDESTVVALNIDDPFDCYLPGTGGCDFAGVTWVRASTFDDGSYDDCNGIKFTVRRAEPYSDCIMSLNTVSGTPGCTDGIQDPVSEFERATAEGDTIKFYCCEVGTTQTVILRVYQLNPDGSFSLDWSGEPLFNECAIQVKVQDQIKPTCTPPPNYTVSCEQFDPSLWLYGKALVNDNCTLDSTKVYLGQKGLAHSASYTNFDTFCNKGTIVRTFRAFDRSGFSSQCTQRIVVNYEQDYFVKFPDDKIIAVCDGSGNYGEPEFYGEDCELLGVTFEDQVFAVVPDACFMIERNWKIINWCTYDPGGQCISVPNPNPNAITNHPSNLPGPVVSPIQTAGDPWKSSVVKVNAADPAPTNYSVFYNPNSNCYSYRQIIKISDGQAPVIQCVASPDTICDISSNDAALWNQMYWWDNIHQTHDLSDAPSEICISASDACNGAAVNIEYQLLLDLDADDVMETRINSTQLGSQPGGLGWNNIPYGNLTGTPDMRQFDGRSVPNNQKWGFAIQETVNGNTKTACVKFNTQLAQGVYQTPQLPYGNHKIKWIVSDGCGNERVCEYPVVVRDCRAPNVVCFNGLAVNIMPSGSITLFVSDFLQFSDDNATPTGMIRYSVRKSGTGSGFPLDANGNPVLSVTFDCNDLGTQGVELWALDLYGNADFCETYILVQDNSGTCSAGSKASVSGALKTKTQDGVEGVEVVLDGTPPNGLPPLSVFGLTNSDGIYAFSNAIPLGSDYTITPFRDDNHLNGVSTFDIVLISKHILGTQPLTSPYDIIAADANKSNSVTTFDIVEIRKMVLGVYQTLPDNTSWRFIDKSHVFINPNDPFLTIFPESRTVQQMQSSQLSDDFVGVKVGDVNGNAVASSVMNQPDDRTAGTLILDADDRAVTAGDIFEVAFRPASEVVGYQMTMNLDGLELVALPAGDRVNTSNFGVFGDAITVSVSESLPFTLRFRALNSGKISEMLHVSHRITRSEAYVTATEGTDRWDVALRFNGTTGSVLNAVGYELLQNVPNPVENSTAITFNLPEGGDASVVISDASGRVLKTINGTFPRGLSTIVLKRHELEAGVLFYQMNSGGFSATKKMIVVE